MCASQAEESEAARDHPGRRRYTNDRARLEPAGGAAEPVAKATPVTARERKIEVPLGVREVQVHRQEILHAAEHVGGLDAHRRHAMEASRPHQASQSPGAPKAQ